MVPLQDNLASKFLVVMEINDKILVGQFFGTLILTESSD